MEYFGIIIFAIIVSNFVLAKFLGICPFVGVSKKIDSAVGMGLAVTFVMTLAAVVTYWVYKILVVFEITFLDTLTFILVIASLVQFVEMFLEKFSPHLYKALGIYLPLITTNCAILGLAQYNIQYLLEPAKYDFNFIKCVLFGFAAGIGFTLALVLMAGIREKLEFANIPKVFKGAPAAFIAAGLMALAFQGFANLVTIAK